jgi:hypothetical protein
MTAMTATKYNSQRNKFLLIAVTYTSVFLIGLADYTTGSEIAFSIFYLLPVLTAVWFLGMRHGIVIVVTSAAVWLAADLLSSEHYRYPIIPYWNGIVRLGFFSIVAYLLNTLKMLYATLEEKIEERTVSLTQEIAEREKAEESLQRYSAELKKSNEELQEALANIKTLKEILPICACCKKIRDDKGYWEGVETYISKHTDTLFSHGYCPECAKKAMKDIEDLKMGHRDRY